MNFDGIGRSLGRPASEVPPTPWAKIPRGKKRVFVQCNHAQSDESAARREVGGVTRDRAINLAGEDMLLSLRKEDIDMPCPHCSRVWRVPVASLDDAARGRGNRAIRVLVQDLPGVSLVT